MTTNSQVEVTVTDDMVIAFVPYHPEFVSVAHNLRGKRTDGKWIFDRRDESRVRELCCTIFGLDGSGSVDVVDVELDLCEFGQLLNSPHLFLLGRQIVWRKERDKKVWLGEGVVITQGGFPASGGSVANPRVQPYPGTIVEVRDVPATHADIRKPHVTIVRQPLTTVGKVFADADLRAERARLVARIAEIDTAIGKETNKGE